MSAERTSNTNWGDLKNALQKRFKIISVEGPIGVGKTTLVKKCREHAGIESIEDTSNQNPLLSEFYTKNERFAFAAQVWFALNRAKLWEKVAKLSQKGSAVVDFMPLREQIFGAKVLAGQEAIVFNQLYDHLFRNTPSPDAVIYLTADTDILMERIAKRGVSYEGRITRKYLQSISDGFHNFFLNCEGLPVLVVNTNDYNIVSDECSVQDILAQLLITGPELQYYNPPSSKRNK